MSLAFSLSSTDPSDPQYIADRDHAVEMSILIAMPDPTSAQPPASRSQSDPSSRRPSTFSTSLHPDPESDGLPLVEIATTVIPIAPLDDDQHQTMDHLRREARARHGTQRTALSNGGVRIERTDGFRFT